MSHQESKAHFFRQGAWLMIATVGGGLFMTIVHSVAGKMGKEEYRIFAVLLRVLILLGVPSAGLQTIFARQTAAAVDDLRRRELTATVRKVLAAIFFIWLAMAGTILFFQKSILATLKFDQPAALWGTLLVILTALLTPVMRGLLQGDQNFMALGWTLVLDGMGRFVSLCIIVLLLHGNTSAAMIGVVIGQVLALSCGVYWARHILTGPTAPVAWRTWLAQAVPFTLGAGSVVFLSSVDCIFVGSVFSPEDSAFYLAAFLIGFAVMQVTGPLAQVMFPKVARSVAISQKSDALKLTLIGTAGFGLLAVIGCIISPDLPLRIVQRNRDLWPAAPLVPWFVGGTLLMALVNVLVNDLLARSRFDVVPWLLTFCVLYVVTLLKLRDHLLTLETFTAFREVILVLSGYSLAALIVAAWYVWGKKRPAPAA